MTRGRRRARGFLAAVLALAAVWSVGFAWFLRETSTTNAPAPDADGIVVLTGGADRVETALHLLAEGRGRLLLISGVGHAADFASLARHAGVDPTLGNRVTLGRMATDTRGNAIEAAAWAEENRLSSLLVVTAGYHMPRALAEIRRVLPDVALHPIAVLPPAMRGGATPSRLRLLAGEYTKWLAVESGLSRIAPRPEEIAPSRAEEAGG